MERQHRAMILAAGRGERLRPITDTLPKPLVRVLGKPLIVRHLEQLEVAGIKSVVINHAWLGDVLEEKLNTYWKDRPLKITFSAEQHLGLETAGGILKVLPTLTDPFIVISGDVFTEFHLKALVSWTSDLPIDCWARLLLVPNPDHHPNGDFVQHADGRIALEENSGNASRYTYSGMGVFRPCMFEGYAHNKSLPLREVLYPAIENKKVEGVVSQAFWADVGTVERLAELRRRYNDGMSGDIG
ncbi:MAG: nucleotidyltransferase family protein [Pseudomonadota bacterium]